MIKQQYNFNIIDEYGLERKNEPVELPIGLFASGHRQDLVSVLDDSGRDIPFQIVGQDKESNLITKSCRAVFLVSTQRGVREYRYKMVIGEQLTEQEIKKKTGGIILLEPVQEDGYKRLDTGVYTLELCRGKANGLSTGKWGIRFLQENKTGENPLPNYDNSIGGVFGPYYTPENGLINVPQNIIVKPSVIEEGPILCQYRFDVDVPDGLDPNLRGSNIEILWKFYYNSNRFDRYYHVSDYETLIDGMPTTNLITVGDEFSHGQGALAFTHFGSLPNTKYHSGDPYFEVLKQVTREILEDDNFSSSVIEEFREVYKDDLNKVSAKWYWKIFDPFADYIDEGVRRFYLGEVRKRARRNVWEPIVDEGLDCCDMVEVSKARDYSIFPRIANKTVMTNISSNQSIVWYTSQPVRRYQIVMNPFSGWVNWGTNGENEYPELPSGSTIKLVYGSFDNLFEEANKLESPLLVKIDT